MAQSVLVINGPNLNLLGIREPEKYGAMTLEEIEADCVAQGREFGISVDCFQSNHEGAIVDAIQSARSKHQAIIINAGAYTHTSIAIRDALAGVALPFYEVHITNVHARERFRHRSYLSAIASGVICGLGIHGYRAALSAIAER